jgi:hypothetical protein
MRFSISLGLRFDLRPAHDRRFVTTLRNKIEPDPHNPVYIHTLREIGYKFDPTRVPAARGPFRQSGICRVSSVP